MPDSGRSLKDITASQTSGMYVKIITIKPSHFAVLGHTLHAAMRRQESAPLCQFFHELPLRTRGLCLSSFHGVEYIAN